MKDRAEMLWRYYADEGQTESDAEAKWPAVAPDVHPPADFDVVDFLDGARALYIKLQQSWAARRVDDLEPFVNPKLFRALQGQAARDPKPVTVDILLVDAELIQLDRLAEREEAKVRFSVSMRSGNETLPQDIHEVWLFSRGEKSKGMWRLDGIEQ
jgi:predicted lipid-binding transport protein (Tim44 family)